MRRSLPDLLFAAGVVVSALAMLVVTFPLVVRPSRPTCALRRALFGRCGGR